MKRVSICFLLLFFITLTASEASATPMRKDRVNTVVGSWILKIVGDTDEGRTISFVMKRGLLQGTYRTSQGQEKTISNAKFSGKSLQFNVPELQLYFQMWLVGDHFEGKMSSSNTAQKIMAVPVTMSRKK